MRFFHKKFVHFANFVLFCLCSQKQFFILDFCIKYFYNINVLQAKQFCRSGGMADAQVSGTCDGNIIWVQLPSLAPYKQKKLANLASFLLFYLRTNSSTFYNFLS